MSIPADISKDANSELKASAAIQRQASQSPDSQLSEGGPGSISQLKHQAKADNSLQANKAIQLQAKVDQYTGQAPHPIQKKPNDTGLPDNLKAGIENLSGHSMDDVKVHYNSAKPAQLNAHAYAQGTDIHLASGQEKHLPHEAWHVVQQKQGRVRPTMQMKGKANINDDTGLEHEADVMGGKSLEMKEDTTAQKHSSDNAPKTTQSEVAQLVPVLAKVKITGSLYNSKGDESGHVLGQNNTIFYDPNDIIFKKGLLLTTLYRVHGISNPASPVLDGILKTAPYYFRKDKIDSATAGSGQHKLPPDETPSGPHSSPLANLRVPTGHEPTTTDHAYPPPVVAVAGGNHTMTNVAEEKKEEEQHEQKVTEFSEHNVKQQPGMKVDRRIVEWLDNVENPHSEAPTAGGNNKTQTVSTSDEEPQVGEDAQSFVSLDSVLEKKNPFENHKLIPKGRQIPHPPANL